MQASDLNTTHHVTLKLITLRIKCNYTEQVKQLKEQLRLINYLGVRNFSKSSKGQTANHQRKQQNNKENNKTKSCSVMLLHVYLFMCFF